MQTTLSLGSDSPPALPAPEESDPNEHAQVSLACLPRRVGDVPPNLDGRPSGAGAIDPAIWIHVLDLAGDAAGSVNLRLDDGPETPR